MINFLSFYYKYMKYFKLMLQTNYLTQTSEILIQKTSNIVLQKKNHFKSSGQLVCLWHRFFLLHLTLKTLYVRKKKLPLLGILVIV